MSTATGSSASAKVGMEGADCADSEGEEQAVLLVDDESGVVTVLQPNEEIFSRTVLMLASGWHALGLPHGTWHVRSASVTRIRLF